MQRLDQVLPEFAKSCVSKCRLGWYFPFTDFPTALVRFTGGPLTRCQPPPLRLQELELISVVCTDMNALSQHVQSLQALTAFTFLHPDKAELFLAVPTCHTFLTYCTSLLQLRLQFLGNTSEVHCGHSRLPELFDRVRLPGVTSIELDTCAHVDPYGMLPRLPKLQNVSLTLHRNSMHDYKALSSLSTLQSCRVDLGSTEIHRMDDVLCDALPHLSATITSLHLQQWLMGGAFPIICTHTNLQHLDLSESEVAHLPSGFDPMRCFRKLRNLKSMLWAGGKLRAEYTIALLHALPDAMTHLDLTGNQFPASGMQPLSRFMDLRVLKIGWAGSRWWTHALAIALASHISALVQLRKLHIQVSDYHGTSASAVQEILKSLKTLPYLCREDYSEIEEDMNVRQGGF